MTSAPPIVSVIIPAFNAAKTIAETVQSALIQTRRDIEIIVIDDGSTDATADIVTGIAADATNVHLHSVENAGQSKARNLALRLARGKYVAPLDSDDLWHPSYLEKMVDALESAGPKASMAYALVRRIDQQSLVTETKVARAVSQRAFHQMLVFNVVGTGSAIVMPRAEALAVGGYETRLRGSEDYLMQLRLARRGLVIAVPEYLVGYRSTAGSLSSRNYAISRTSKNLIAIAEDEFRDADRRTLAQAKARINADAFVHAVKARKYQTAVQDIVTALANSPAETVWTLLRKADAKRHRASQDAASTERAHFLALEPTDRPQLPIKDHIARRLDAAMQIDAAVSNYDIKAARPLESHHIAPTP